MAIMHQISRPSGDRIITAGRLCLFLALLSIGLMSFHTITEPDMGYHLHAGQWILRNTVWPGTDAFTYTVPDHPYIDLHWLYQVTITGIHSLGGELLMVIFHAFFTLLAFALAARQSLRRRASPGLVAVLTVIGAMASDHRFSVRPEVISWVLLMITVGILESKWKWWCLPLVTLLWVNIQGIFIIGPAMIGCFLLDDLIRHRSFRRQRWIPGLAACAAPLLNPYGLRGVLFPLTLSTRLSGENRFAATIGEFLSPLSLNSLIGENSVRFMVGGWYVFTILTLAAVTITLRRRTPADILRVIVFGVLAAQAVRNIPLFFLAALPVTSQSLMEIWNSLRAAFSRHARIPRFRPAVQPVVAITGVLFMLLLNTLIVTGSWHELSGKMSRFGYRLNPDFLPVNAVEFLNQQAIRGRVLNELRYGGYLGWKWSEPVFIDGRLEVMGHAFFKEYELARHLQIPWQLVHRWRPDIAIFGYTSIPGWFDQFLKNPGWRLVYLDRDAAVFLRNGFMDRI
ncbi:MAG TPA: hypothetical protein PLV45_11165, partial [bacterium]|nr:hypothetical protein [bacterium]